MYYYVQLPGIRLVAAWFCVACGCHVIYQINLLLLVLMVLVSQYCNAASGDISRHKYLGLQGQGKEVRVLFFFFLAWKY